MSQPVPPNTETAITTTYTGPEKLLGTGIPGTEVAELTLSRPKRRRQNSWVVFARVVILNRDHDAQDFVAMLFNTSDATSVDRVDVRLPAPQGNPLGCCISLQAAITTGLADVTIQLLCTGFHAAAQQISMIALDVTGEQTQ
jgi:hypothetical protein